MDNFPLGMRLQVESSPNTDLGRKRSNNEDWVAGFEPSDLEEIQYSGNLYIVADGVGGASKGERASKYAAQKVLYEYYQHPEIPTAERLSLVIRGACKDIYHYSTDNGMSRMATTMVAAIIRGDKLTVANVGDSRGYLLRADKVIQITRDHNLADELVRNGSMTSEEAKHSKTRNKLLRSLGGEPDVEVDVFGEIQLYPDDLILLCTDGLTRYATEDDLIRLSADGSPEEIGQKMVGFANQSGGADNVSVYLIEIKEPGDIISKPKFSHVLEPVDWDSIQTQFDNHKIYRRRKSRRPLRIIAIVGLLGIITIISILSVIIFGKNNNIQVGLVSPTSSPEATSIVITPATYFEPTLFPSQNSPIPSEDFPLISTEITTISPTLADFMTGSPTPELNRECIYRVQSNDVIGICEIFQQFHLDRSLCLETIDQVSNCDEMISCSERSPVPDRNNIQPGMNLVIPGQTIETCNLPNSYWVIIPDTTN